MTVRRATGHDVDALVALRRAMWDEMHPAEPTDAPMLLATAEYLRVELATDRLCAWLVESGGVPVGVALLLVHEHPPRITGREIRGYVTAVFVDSAHRRRGHAGALLSAIVEHARANDFRRLMLRTSEDGRRVYESVGFRSMEVLAQDFTGRR